MHVAAFLKMHSNKKTNRLNAYRIQYVTDFGKYQHASVNYLNVVHSLT